MGEDMQQHGPSTGASHPSTPLDTHSQVRSQNLDATTKGKTNASGRSSTVMLGRNTAVPTHHPNEIGNSSSSSSATGSPVNDEYGHRNYGVKI